MESILKASDNARATSHKDWSCIFFEDLSSGPTRIRHRLQLVNIREQTHKALRGSSYASPLQTKIEVKGIWFSQLDSALTATVSAFHQRLCLIFWKWRGGGDESGLKRRLKCWSAWGGSSRDSAEHEGRGYAASRDLAMVHVLTKYIAVMFNSNIFVCPLLKRKVGASVSMRFIALLWDSFFFFFSLCIQLKCYVCLEFLWIICETGLVSHTQNRALT